MFNGRKHQIQSVYLHYKKYKKIFKILFLLVFMINKENNFEEEKDKKYNELLDKLYKQVKRIKVSERFEVPKVEGMIEGSKTIITNFSQICSILRRKPEHLAKFLSRELAAQASIEGDRLILNRRLLSTQINDKIQAYVNEFVICPECKKPDTELIKEKNFMFLHCLACGAKHSVRAKIV